MKKIYNDSADLLSDETFVSYHYGTANKEQTHFWNTWIAENSDKLGIVADARKMLDMLSMHITDEEYQVEKEKLFGNLEYSAPKKVHKLKVRWSWVIAASFLLIGTISFYQIYYRDAVHNKFIDNTATTSEQWMHVSAQNGEIINVNLTDGSRITLMGGSTLRYPKQFRKDTMYVQLEGDARFNIAKKADRTFAVKTQNALVTVLGTQFLIEKADTANTRVSLFSGKIRLTNRINRKEVLLSPEQQGYITNDGIQTNAFAPIEVSNFEKGILHFHNASFAEVARKMEQYYGAHIMLNTPNARWRYTGHFEKLPVEDALAAICFTKKLSSKKISSNRYVLY